MSSPRRFRRGTLATAAVATLAVAGPALAMTDHSGQPIPNSAPASTTSLGSSTVGTLLADPAARALTAPACLGAGAVKGPLSPEEDLARSLELMASDPANAATWRARAIDLLEGNPVQDLVTPALPAVYSGIPLLGTVPPGAVRTISSNATPVAVTTIRFGEHVVSDTSALKFTDVNTPFKVKFTFVELGGAAGGMFTPTPLLGDAGGAIGGLNSVSMAMGMPETDTGTTVRSRFSDLVVGGSGCAAEHTRLAVRTVTVDMPPPKYVQTILDPNLRQGHEAVAAIRVGGTAMDTSAIGTGITRDKLSPLAPENQIWGILDPASPDFQADDALASAAARPLVAGMRTKGRLPNGVVASPTADLTVAFVNNEVYTSAKALHAPPGEAIRVHVENTDLMGHDVRALALSGRSPVFGPLVWGQFSWQQLGATTAVPAGGSVDLVLTAPSDTFSLSIGDPFRGASATSLVQVDRGPRIEGFQFPNPFDLPLHNALDANGDIWVTIPGSDSVGRLRPASRLSDSTFERFLVPGGLHDGQAPEPNFAPTDIAVDGNGFIWVTMPVGNAIGRIDPSKVHNGTTDGIRVYKLEPCPNTTVCAPPPPPAPITALTREPLQITTQLDGDGNAVVWFTEAAADAIGILRVAPDGTALSVDGNPVPDEQGALNIPCSCSSPFGISLDTQGTVWFTEAVSNRLGRLTPNQARPFSPSSVKLDHFPLPNGVTVVDAELFTVEQPPGSGIRVAVPVTTVLPHSVHVDPQGRVWWTEQATARVGRLDPANAVPGTSAGIQQFSVPRTEFNGTPQPADISTDRAGNVYVSDEYGDQIAKMSPDGSFAARYRPIERLSLTDKPMPDQLGNLYFMEAGAGLLTRVRGVTAGNPLPAAPTSWSANLTDNRVRGLGVREMTSADVQVLRGGAVVASATGVPVVAGRLTAGDSGAPWQGANGDPLHAGDTVRITPRGTNAPGAFTFPVADLQFALGGASVSGSATHGGTPLFGTIRVSAPRGGGSASIDAATGAFSVSLPAAVSAADDGSLTWTRGLPAAQVQTVVGFAGDLVVAPPDPGTTPPAVGPSGGPGPAAASCTRGVWITRSGSTWKVPLLGRTAAGVKSCLGAPTKRAKRRGAEVWTYGRSLVVVFRAGRVGTLGVGRGIVSSPAGLQVGARAKGLPVRTAAIRGGLRSVVKTGKAYADIRITVKRSRISSLTVSLVTRAKLDARGRRLAAGGR